MIFGVGAGFSIYEGIEKIQHPHVVEQVYINYIVLGFALKETEHRTQRFFSGLAVLIREWVEKLADALRGIFGGPERA